MAISERDVIEFRDEIQIAKNRMKQQKEKIWDKCRDFYVGNHKPAAWSGRDHDFITVNLIFSNIVSQMPFLSFKSPKYSASTAESVKLEDPNKIKQANRQADIVAAKLNHERKKQDFREHFQLGVLDSFFAFGCYKVMHKVQTKPNPRAGEPKLQDDGTPIFKSGEPVLEADEVPKSTDFIVRRVRPENFLIDPQAGNFISSARWVAERIPMRTREARKKFDDNTIPSIGQIDENNRGLFNHIKSIFDRQPEQGEESSLQMSVVYEIWDRQNERKFYMVEGKENKVYKETRIPDDYLENEDKTPYCILKYYEVPDDFYPIPDVFPQLSLNLSYDISRSQINQYRKQSILKILAQKGAVDENELEKLESNKAFELIFTEANPNINPPFSFMKPPSIPAGVFEHLNLDADDLRKVSGVTREMQGTPQANQKATQSLLTNQSAKDKGSWKQMKIANVASKIGRKMLILIKNRIKQGGTVKIEGPDGITYQQYLPEDFQGNFEIDVEYGSGRPKNDEAEKTDFMQAMTMITQVPQLLRHFDTASIAEEFTRHFPIAKVALREEPDQTAFQGQEGGGSGGGGDTMADRGTRELHGANAPGPSPNQQGMMTTQRNMQGGLGG